AAVVPGPDRALHEDPGADRRQVEPSVATDPGDPLHLVAASEDNVAVSFDQPQIRVYLSRDGGESWSSSLLPQGQTRKREEPSVTFCADGTVYVCMREFGGAGEDQSFPVFRSLDGGQSWEERTPAQVSPGARAYPSIVCDDSGGAYTGRLHVRYVSVGKIYAVYSDDQAASWSDPVKVFPTGEFASNFPGQMVVGPSGDVWIGYIKQTAPSEIRTVVSWDGGVTWDPPETVSRVTEVVGQPKVDYYRSSQPTLAIDRSGGPGHGKAHVVFSDATTGDSDLLYSQRDEVLGWFPPVRLNDDAEGNGKDQDFPRMVIDPRGVVRVVWLDHRNDPGDGSIEVWGKLSRDGGQNFEADFQISDRSFLAPTGSKAFLGDYIGLTASDFVSRPLWPDRRSDEGDIYTAVIRDFPLDEVGGVRVTRGAGTTVSWTSLDPVHGPETVYAMVSGALADLAADGGYLGAGCLQSDIPDTPYVDTRPDPSAGEGVYYILQARKADERGSFGAATSPDARVRLDLAPPCAP
ncbi:MAG TPA: exo-alpha-sialidase, partial [Acidobacteria bacterium]|nr:exo-alpha-sialidase [Acidobacteriota bacterium]